MRKDGYFRFRGLVLILWILTTLSSTHKAHAQISHGGMPLEQGAENFSKLRTAVDYFVEMPSFDLDSVLANDNLAGNRVGGLNFAYKFFVNLTPENSGVVFHTEDGTKIWKVGIRSPKAFSLNVLFKEFTLPEKAQVYLYNSDRTRVLGSFTRENRPNGGEFSIAPVEGEEITIEYHEPPDVSFSGKICISEVNHDYRGLFRAGTRFKMTILPCIPDLSCDSQYDTIGRSVCLLIINGVTYCTGTLINNTAKDGKPYLLTASHCLNNNADMGSRIVVFMNYLSPRCDTRIRGSEEFSVSGSVTRALSNEIDFALVELTEVPPPDYRPYLAGWSLDKKTSNAPPFTGIHHPFGEVKKYCVEEDSITPIDWTNGGGIASGNHWYVEKWEVGHTWSGSSGSPIFDGTFKLRGGLTGGSSGGNLGCSPYSSGDYYFRLDKAWDQFSNKSKQLKHWLDPLSPDSIKSPVSLNGLDPYANNSAKRINNLLPTDSLTRLSLSSPNWGCLTGHNSQGTSSFAEHFTTTDSSMIHGVYLVVGKGNNNSNLPITVRVYQGGSKPGKILGKSILNPNYIDFSGGSFITKTKTSFSNRENYIRFDSPISVGTDFYVGYQISYPLTAPEDSFYVYAALRKTTTNTAFLKQNTIWTPYTNYSSIPIYTSLWIEPILSGDTIKTPNTFSEEDPDSLAKNLLKNRPILAYSSKESVLYIALPTLWSGNTTLEVFDMTGSKILEKNIFPPVGAINLPKTSGRLLLIRLKNNTLVYVQKMAIGFE